MPDVIICPNCEYENNKKRVYCKECGKRLKRRLWPLFFLFLLLLYPIFSSYELPVNVEKEQLIEQPFQIKREITSQLPIETPVCENRSYRFSILGGNVDKIKGNVRPNLLLNNLEDKWGWYKVNFSYIDAKKFPYDTYGGQYLKENLRTGKISHKDAGFYSSNYEFLLGPGESITIRNQTPSLDTNAIYWAIATIIEPNYEFCYVKTHYVNKTENKTFIEYKETVKIVEVKEYRELKNIIGIANFIEWLILLFLLFLIIILIIKNKEKFTQSQYKK